ncbi:methionine adenosyltransferase [Candidatus Bathyarchaeota archaeon]|nr:methionine adenosyltransferase [Candidatus Bathyarchaeota archaeon]
MALKVTKSIRPPIEESGAPEICERKGKGHPDSVADECAEAVSRELCNYYSEHFGQVFHHNVDKYALIGGIAKPKFGGGDIIEPQKLLAIGRATDQVMIDGKLHYIPVGPIAIKAARNVIKKTFRNLNPDVDCIIDHVLRPGSIDLVGVFDAGTQIPLANDTSFGVGYAPYSDAEKITLETELMLNGDSFKDKCPGSGEDIKVMTHRIGKDVNVTICNAMVSKFIEDQSAYINSIDMIKSSVKDLAAKIIPDKNVTVNVNTGDIYEEGKEDGVYFLTITGTSAENGDDGIVGRGNRASGLITPTNGRPQTLEAAAGKNPINHVGKIYSLMANQIASKIVEESGGDAKEVYVRLLSQIGHPINEPWLGDIEIIPASNVEFSSLEKLALDIAQNTLDDWMDLRKRTIAGQVRVW